MGRVRSSPILEKSAPKAPSEQAFQSEEELNQELEQERKDKPAFFTWIDGQGQLRYQLIPNIESEKAAPTDNPLEQTTNHTLLASLRNAKNWEGQCCEQYLALFKPKLQGKKPLVLSQLAHNKKFLGQPAAYFSLPEFSLSNAEPPILSLRLYGEKARVGLVALDAEGKMLHFIAQLQGQEHPATWRKIASQESLISLADTQVRYMVLFFANEPSAKAQLEVLWR